MVNLLAKLQFSAFFVLLYLVQCAGKMQYGLLGLWSYTLFWPCRLEVEKKITDHQSFSHLLEPQLLILWYNNHDYEADFLANSVGIFPWRLFQ